MAYAKTTSVPVYKSKHQLEVMVKKYGATSFGLMEHNGVAQVAFSMAGRNILFRVRIPETDQEERSIWRALILSIKGKLESAERGIESFEEAFLAQVMMPNGKTVGEHTTTLIEAHYEEGSDVPLLPKP